ncbi:hypothetical protein [Corynebacterium coyleae]
MTTPHEHDETPNDPKTGTDFPSGDSGQDSTKDSSASAADCCAVVSSNTVVSIE